jgi:hypothetical protein
VEGSSTGAILNYNNIGVVASFSRVSFYADCVPIHVSTFEVRLRIVTGRVSFRAARMYANQNTCAARCAAIRMSLIGLISGPGVSYFQFSADDSNKATTKPRLVVVDHGPEKRANDLTTGVSGMAQRYTSRSSCCVT